MFKCSAPIVVGAISRCEWIGLQERQLVEGRDMRGAAVLLLLDANTVRFGSVRAIISYAQDLRGK